MTPQDGLRQLAARLKALSDENRLRVVGLLAIRPRYGEELAELLDLSPATVSHHTARLRESGLIHAMKEPPYVRFRLDRERLASVADRLSASLQWHDEFGLPDDASLTDRILREALDDEDRLAEIPGSRRKRSVILRWLALQFETGRIYPEREVRRVLMERSPHFEALRKLLLEEGWMQQQGGVYRRLEEVEEE